MKRAKSIAVASILTASMLASSVVGFAADYDLKHKTDPAKNTKILTILKKANRDQFKEVARNMKDYYIEYGGKDFELKAYDAKWTEAVSKHPDLVKDGKITEKMIFGFEPMPAEATIAPLAPSVQEFEVTEISAITQTQVKVVFKAALAEDVKGAKLNVIDNNKAKVEVVAQDLSKGATGATFLFVKALDKAPEGLWMVNGIAKDFDLGKNIQAFIDAADQIELNKALVALKIANLKAENSNLYLDNKADFLTKNPIPTVAQIQQFIDEINDDIATAVDAKPIIEAATKNQDVLLVNLLKAGGFDRLNEEWIISNYKDGSGGGNIAALPPDISTKKDIQEQINKGNDAAAAVEGAAIAVTSEIAKAQKAKMLIFNYHTEDVAPATTKADLIKAIDQKIVLLKLKNAKSELTAYNALEELKADPALKAFYPGLKTYYLNEAPSLSALTIADANTDVIGAAETAFCGKVVAAQGAGDADALLKLLKKYPVENVLDANKAAYLAAATGAEASLKDVEKIVTKGNKAALQPNAAKSAEDLESDKAEYFVGDDFVITFTLKDAAGKVLTALNGETDATVEVAATTVALAKAKIVNGKVTVTGKMGAAEAKNDLKVTLVDPALANVTKVGVQIIVKAAVKPTYFSAAKGGTNGVKFEALDINYKKIAGFNGPVRMDNVVLKKKDGAEYTQPVALNGLTAGNVVVTFNNGEKDNQLHSAPLDNGDYQLTFTVDGVTHTLTFTK